MCDKFGSIRSRRGPRGFPGKDALKLHLWFPESLLKLFQECATCNFYFNNTTDGIYYDGDGKAIGLKNQSKDEKNAICEGDFVPSLIKTKKTYSLTLKHNTRFKISNIGAAIKPKSVLVIAFSFKLLSEIKDEESYYIFSNNNGSRAVSIKKNYLDIAGCLDGSPQLLYLPKAWNYMLIQYSRVSAEGADQCFFYLNGRKGFFEPRVYLEETRDLFIGHPQLKTANCALNCFQVHERHVEFNDYTLPDVLSTLLLKDFKKRIPGFGYDDESSF